MQKLARPALSTCGLPSSYLGAHSSPTRGHPDTQEHIYHREKVGPLTAKAALEIDDNEENMQLLRKHASLENAYQANVVYENVSRSLLESHFPKLPR